MEVLLPCTSSIIDCFLFNDSFWPSGLRLPSFSLSLVQEIMHLLVTGEKVIRKLGPENRISGGAVGHCHIEIKLACVLLLPASKSVLLLNSLQSHLPCFLCSQLSALSDHVVKSQILRIPVHPYVQRLVHSAHLSSFSTW